MPQFKINERDEVEEATPADGAAPQIVIAVNGGGEDQVFFGARHTIKDNGVLEIRAHGRRGRAAVEFGPAGWFSVAVFDYIKPQSSQMQVF